MEAMKRVLVIAALVWSLLLALLLQTSIKDWLWTHPWWHSFVVALPGIVVAGIGLLELRHSGEANELAVWCASCVPQTERVLERWLSGTANLLLVTWQQLANVCG